MSSTFKSSSLRILRASNQGSQVAFGSIYYERIMVASERGPYALHKPRALRPGFRTAALARPTLAAQRRFEVAQICATLQGTKCTGLTGSRLQFDSAVKH